MGRQYKREYSLLIVDKRNGNTRVITDLRVNFEITKSIISYPNLARIDIYNPNQDTLTALQSKFTKILFNAGYEGNLKLIFQGEIRNLVTLKQGVDRIVSIYAADGALGLRNAVFNKTLEITTAVKDIVLDVIKAIPNVITGTTEGLPEGAEKLRGETLSGSSQSILDQYANEYSFDWSIENGAVTITPVGVPLQNAQAVLITSSTGMIGSPVITGIEADIKDISALRVEVRTLLNPSLFPHSKFQIESVSADNRVGDLFFTEFPVTTAEGVYKTQEVKFIGDSREGDWLSVVKGRSISVG